MTNYNLRYKPKYQSYSQIIVIQIYYLSFLKTELRLAGRCSPFQNVNLIKRIKDILKKDLYQRIIFGFGLILWTLIMWDGITEHPNLKSSIGISYMTLYMIPAIILGLQIIRNNIIFWGITFGLFSSYIFMSLITGISDIMTRTGNHVKSIDWNLKELIMFFAFFIALGIIDWVIFQLKPKRII